METLANWLWQGLLLTAFLAAAIGRLPRISAATRYLLWWAALASVLAIPLLRETARRTGIRDGSSSVAQTLDARPHPLIPELPAPPAWLADALFVLWAGSAAVGGIRLVRALIHLRGLKRTSSPLTSGEAGSGAPSSRQSWPDPVEVRISDEIATPCAAGVGRPVILIPRRIVDALSVRDLRLVVLHEQAHLVRRDDWTRLLQAVIKVFAGLHPAVRWISNRIDAEREAACDELVVAATGSAAAYSSCLANVASISAAWGPKESAAAALVPGIAGDGLSLENRVRRLLAGKSTFGSRAARLAFVSGAALIALLTGLVLRSGMELRIGSAPVSVQASMAPQAAAVPELIAFAAPSPVTRLEDRILQGRPSVTRGIRPAGNRPPGPSREAQDGIEIDSHPGGPNVAEGLPALQVAEIPLAPREDSLQSISLLDVQQSKIVSLQGTPSRVDGGKGGGDWASPWVETADRARRGGTAVAGFFSRTGRSIAGVF